MLPADALPLSRTQVKPVFMKGILKALAPHLEERHLVVSIAAGLTIDSLEAALPAGARVVRVMPNTPWCVPPCTGHAILFNAPHPRTLTCAPCILASVRLQ